RLLGQEKPFMHEMVFAVRDEMQVTYPELKETAERVAKVVLAEELQFARVIGLGAQKLDAYFNETRSLPEQSLVDENLSNDFVNSMSTSGITRPTARKLLSDLG